MNVFYFIHIKRINYFKINYLKIILSKQKCVEEDKTKQ